MIVFLAVEPQQAEPVVLTSSPPAERSAVASDHAPARSLVAVQCSVSASATRLVVRLLTLGTIITRVVDAGFSRKFLTGTAFCGSAIGPGSHWTAAEGDTCSATTKISGFSMVARDPLGVPDLDAMASNVVISVR